jgi:hypothetical protein
MGFIIDNTEQSADALHSSGGGGDGEVMILSLHDASTVDAERRKCLNEVAKACMDAEQGSYSPVFECLPEPARFMVLRHTASDLVGRDRGRLRLCSPGVTWRLLSEPLGAAAIDGPKGISVAWRNQLVGMHSGIVPYHRIHEAPYRSEKVMSRAFL